MRFVRALARVATISVGVATQSAAQTASDPLAEPMCVYSAVRQAARTGAATPNLTETLAACRSRYGWTEADAKRVQAITVSMFMYQEEGSKALDMGVPAGTIESVFATLSPDQIKAYGAPGKPKPEGNSAAVQAVVERLKARNLNREQILQAHRAIGLRATGVNLIEEFHALRASAN